MPPETHFTFRDFEPSDAISAYVRDKAVKLDTFYDRITAVRIAVESPHRHHHQGRAFRVRIDLVVPGGELVVGSAPPADDRHTDPFEAVDAAFDEAERVLRDFAGKRRGYTKSHTGPRRGRIARLFPEQGYGFLETAEGEEIYFHKNSVLDGGFAKLRVGTPVRF